MRRRCDHFDDAVAVQLALLMERNDALSDAGKAPTSTGTQHDITPGRDALNWTASAATPRSPDGAHWPHYGPAQSPSTGTASAALSGYGNGHFWR